MTKIAQGLNMVGICKGIKVEQSGEYTNEYLGIAVSIPDGYGGTSETIEDIPIFGEQGENIKRQVQELIGKPVSISFTERALKSDRTGNAYMRRSIHQNSNLNPL